VKTGGSIATTVMLGKDTFRLAEGDVAAEPRYPPRASGRCLRR
jgi:hypothetical protein